MSASHNISQLLIITQLLRIYKHYKLKDEENALTICLRRTKGICVGATLKFLGSASLSSHPKKSGHDLDDLTHMRNIINTIVTWDETTSLTEQTLKNIRIFAKQITSFHLQEFATEGALDQIVFFDGIEGPAFREEFKISADLTLEQLKTLLPMIAKENRMLVYSADSHTTGSHDTLYYNPNNSKGWVETKEIAKELFAAHKQKADHPSPFTIRVYAETKDEKIATYPEPAELLDRLHVSCNTDQKYAGGCNALHMAAKFGDLKSLTYHLAKNPHLINSFDAEAHTPIFTAAQKNQIEIVRALLAAGANPNIARSSDNCSPLFAAADKGNTECIKLLIEAKANVNAPLKNGATATLYAAKNNHLEALRVLLDAGADLNLRSSDGYSPLMVAVEAGNIECAELLLEHGADINQSIEIYIRFQGRIKKTAYDFASTPEMKSILNDAELRKFLKLFPAPIDFSQGFLAHTRIIEKFNERGLALTRFAQNYMGKQSLSTIIKVYQEGSACTRNTIDKLLPCIAPEHYAELRKSITSSTYRKF